MTRPTPAETIRAALETGGSSALTNIPPVIISGLLKAEYDPTSPQTLLKPCVEVTPVVNPLLDALLIQSGARKLGTRTYAVGFGRDSDTSAAGAILDAVNPGLIYTEPFAFNAEQSGNVVSYYSRPNAARDVIALYARTPAIASYMTDTRRRALGNQHPTKANLLNSAITLVVNNNQLYIKVITSGLYLGGRDNVPSTNLDHLKTGSRIDPVPMTAHRALELLTSAATVGHQVIDLSESQTLNTLRQTLTNSAVALPVKGRPAEALMVVGRRINLGDAMPEPRTGHAAAQKILPAQRVAEIDEGIRSLDPAAGITSVIHPDVADVAAMAGATPTAIETLRPYQNQAVGVHLSTQRGFTNASAPGLGKTIMTLTGMRLRAQMIPRYRTLVAVPAAIRTQWGQEAAKFFPEARVLVLRAKRDADKLADLLVEAGNDPVLVISSFEMVSGVATLAQEMVEPRFRTLRQAIDARIARRENDEKRAKRRGEPYKLPATDLAEVLAAVNWHDIVCDEAALVLKNPGSKRTQALWALRRDSGIAIALTGTPIDKSLDDLGRLLAWTRNEQQLFDGVRLAQQFDLTKKGEIERFRDAIGPLVFRRDRSEVADELPEVVTEVVTFDPTPAELKLATAARTELKRIYQDLVKRLEEAAKLSPDDPRYKEAKEQLKSARGAMLGGVTLARIAASDPAAVAASDSAGAMLLKSKGLVQAATRQAGTKRAQIVELVDELVGRDEKVLIFTDFATVAAGLLADLRSRGVSVGAILGGQTPKQRDEAVNGYQSGDLDVLVCTSAAREGLNLQATDALIHMDLPWSPSAVVQRQARANRIGAQGKTLQVLIPVMAGTIEERVAGVLISRSVTAMAALDAARGVDVKQTEMGLALGGLVAAANENELAGGEVGLMSLAREILAD